VLQESALFDFKNQPSPADFFSLRTLLIRHWPRLFTSEDSLWLSARIHADTLRERFTSTMQSLFVISDQSTDAFTLQHDPFHLADKALHRLAAFRPSPDIFFENGFITNRSRDRILIIVTAQSSSLDESTSQALTRVIEKAGEKVADQGVELTWMGAHRASLDNSAAIKKDIHLTAPVTILLIIIICLSVYGRFHYGLLVFVPTILGILFSFALYSVFNTISIIMIGFSAALAGMSVDYAIHFFYHLQSCPEDPTPARSIGRAILASAFTTAGAFAVLAFARIPALTQLGFLTALSILFVALFSLWALPAFFTARKNKGSRPKVNLPSIFSLFYTRLPLAKISWSFIALALVLWFFAIQITFDGDPDNLNGMAASTIKAQEKIEEHWRGIDEGTYCAVSGSSQAEALRNAEKQLVPCIESLIVSNTIFKTKTIVDILPSPAQQARNLDRWLSFWENQDRTLLKNTIIEVTEKMGIPADRFLPYCSQLIDTAAIPVLTLTSFPTGLQQGLIGNYLFEKKGLWYAGVPVILTKGAQWERLSKEALDHGVLAVNDALLGLRLMSLVKQGFSSILFIIPFFVIILLFIIFHKPGIVLLGVIPSLLSTGITLGAMSLLSLPINIVSSMVLAFIFGLGIDYTVFMIHTIQHSNLPTPRRYSQGASSISVAALTTLSGLGMMVFASHPVLSLLGKVGTLGILSSYAAAIITVPALRSYFMK